MKLTLDIDSLTAVAELAMLLDAGDAGRGEVVARLRTEGETAPLVRLGRNFRLDGELAERIAEIAGVANVALTAMRSRDHLRLVA